MRMTKLIAALSLWMFACLAPCRAQDPDDEHQQAPDFSLSQPFLQFLQENGIQPVLRIKMEHRTNTVHPLKSDCEMHIAGMPENIGAAELGDPSAIVVEPPNMCKIPPVGFTKKVSEKKLREEVWPNTMDEVVIGQTCEVRGFPRIFTEHASGGEDTGGPNPNHVLEVHPAISIKCGARELNFTKALSFIPGMRAIKPASARSCIEQRQLWVRFNSDDNTYEFRESGGQCGNFAIVEVGKLNRKFVQKVKGGHSAIARVSADGLSRSSLKIYTLEGTGEDGWLAKVRESGTGNQRKLIHGMLTYDYFALVRILRNRETGEWQKPAKWTPVLFPLALVIFGEADQAPWSDET